MLGTFLGLKLLFRYLEIQMYHRKEEIHASSIDARKNFKNEHKTYLKIIKQMKFLMFRPSHIKYNKC